MRVITARECVGVVFAGRQKRQREILRARERKEYEWSKMEQEHIKREREKVGWGGSGRGERTKEKRQLDFPCFHIFVSLCL